MSNVKGSSLLHRQAFVTERHGATGWRDLVASLPEEDASALSPRILASAWYPFALYNRLDEALCAPSLRGAHAWKSTRSSSSSRHSKVPMVKMGGRTHGRRPCSQAVDRLNAWGRCALPCWSS
jgi:hypothetical protein